MLSHLIADREALPKDLPASIALFTTDYYSVLPRSTLCLPVTKAWQMRCLEQAHAQGGLVGVLCDDASSVPCVQRVATLTRVETKLNDIKKFGLVYFYGVERVALTQECTVITPYRQVQFTLFGCLDNDLSPTMVAYLDEQLEQYREYYPELYNILRDTFFRQNYLQLLTYLLCFFMVPTQTHQAVLGSMSLDEAMRRFFHGLYQV